MDTTMKNVNNDFTPPQLLSCRVKKIPLVFITQRTLFFVRHQTEKVILDFSPTPWSHKEAFKMF